MNGLTLTVVLVVFLAVLVVAGTAGGPTGLPRRPRRRAPAVVEDTDPDEIADDDAPSRDDD
jgi:hypothetical protein